MSTTTLPETAPAKRTVDSVWVPARAAEHPIEVFAHAYGLL